MRLLNLLRRRRPVPQPARVWVRAHVDGITPSIEGWWVGTTSEHYLLDASQLVTESRTDQLTGLVHVPRARVAFLQQLHVEVPA